MVLLRSESGRGAQEACLPVDGERVRDESCARVADLYGPSTCDFAGDGFSGAGLCALALGVFDLCRRRAGGRVCGVYEEVLLDA